MASRGKLRNLLGMKMPNALEPRVAASDTLATPAPVSSPSSSFAAVSRHALHDTVLDRSRTRRPEEAVRLVANLRAVGQWGDIEVNAAFVKWVAQLVRQHRSAPRFVDQWPAPLRRAYTHVPPTRLAEFADLVARDVHRSFDGYEYDLRRITEKDITGGVLENALSDVERMTALRERLKRRANVLDTFRAGLDGRTIAIGAGLVGASVIGVGVLDHLVRKNRQQG